MIRPVNPIPTTPSISPLTGPGSNAPFIENVCENTGHSPIGRSQILSATDQENSTPKSYARESLSVDVLQEMQIKALIKLSAHQDHVIAVLNSQFSAWKVDPGNRDKIDKMIIKPTQASTKALITLRTAFLELEDLLGRHGSDTTLAETEELRTWLGSEDDIHFSETESAGNSDQ